MILFFFQLIISINIFKKDVLIPDFKGCFLKPSSVPFLSNHGDMTITLCREMCRGNKFQFSATHNTTNCFCIQWEEFETLVKANDSDCDKRCAGNYQQYCGSTGTVPVFFVGKI